MDKMKRQVFLIFLSFIFIIEAARGNLTGDSSFSDTPEETSSSCETRGKTTATLDLAIQLIKNVKDSYPVCPSKPFAIDCEDVLRNGHNKSGVYKIFPKSRVVLNPIEVYCDMDTDGGGWTVFQRRGNFLRHNDSFYQDWKAYKEGFGDVEKEFWLGNDNIFGLSNQRNYAVRFDLQDMEGSRRYALYDSFWIDDEDHKYALHIDGYSGDAGDSMIKIHNAQNFSTKDQQNDNQPSGSVSCASQFKGGWWYNRCHLANLNGLNLRGPHESYADGINWHSWKGYKESLDRTEIKIRSKKFRR